MRRQLQKRPESKHKLSLRPVSNHVNEANQKQSEECFQMGKKHMAKEEFEQALRHYFNATIHDPGNFKAYCNMGMIFKKLKNYKEAKNAYLQALRGKPDDSISLYNLGNLYRVTGDDDAAIEQYQKVLNLRDRNKQEIGSLYDSCCINVGICFKNMGNIEEAIFYTEKALKVSPKDESALFNKAMCLLSKVQLINKNSFSKVQVQLCDQAEQAFNQVLAIDQKNLIARLEKAQLCYLRTPIKQSFMKAFKQNEQILKEAILADDKEYIKLKIAYCDAAIKKFEESEKYEKEQLKKDIKEIKEITERKQSSSNKYDQANLKEKEKENNTVEEREKAPSRREVPSRKRSAVEEENLPSIQELSDKGLSKTKIIDELLENGQYDEAFDVAKELPEGPLQYEKQILVNVRQSEDSGEEYFLNSAWSIYEQKVIQFDRSKPITFDMCSAEAHSIYATMLNILGEYEQALKHYEVLMHFLQDKQQKNEHEKEQLQQIYADIGVCYIGTESMDRAIEEFKKSLELQPNNYFLLTNLGGSLVEKNRKDEALKLYTDFFNNAGGENMQDKITYIDCLLNIAICQESEEDETKCLQKTREELEKHFPTFEDINNNFSIDAILGMYLKLAEFVEKEADGEIDITKRKEVNEKLLNIYLALLEFPRCPDRDAINFNCGILFYLAECYANAYAFFKKAVKEQGLISNILGLTLAHLDEYSAALMYLEYGCEQEPDNVIYQANLEIIQWVCGIETSQSDKKGQNMLKQRYENKSQPTFSVRAQYGLGLIKKLTNWIMDNTINVDRNEKITISEQVSEIIAKLDQEKYSQKSEICDKQNKKMDYLKNFLEKESRITKEKENQNSKWKIPSSIMETCFKECASFDEFKNSFASISAFLQNIPQTIPQSLSIIQILTAVFIIKNKKHQYALTALNTEHKSSPLIKLESQACASENMSYNKKQFQLTNPQKQLNFSLLKNLLQDNEAVVENISSEMISYISSVYYSCEGIFLPMKKELVYPHCEKFFDCDNCWMKSMNLFFNALGGDEPLDKNRLNSRNWCKQFKKFPREFEQYINEQLHKKEGNNVFNHKKSTVCFENGPSCQPFLVKVYFKTFDQANVFLQKVDKSFVLPANLNNKKGTQLMEMNKSLLMQVYWGQDFSEFQNYWVWLSRRKVIPEIESLVEIDGDLSYLKDLIENGSGWLQKIKNEILLFKKQ